MGARKGSHGSAFMSPWERYEETARLILRHLREHFNLSEVEGPQKINGALTSWSVEAKGLVVGGGFYIIECRLRKRRPNQEEIGGLVFRIQDTGAAGAIIVTPNKLQAGASRVANGAGVHQIVMTRESASSDFLCIFLGKLFLGVPGVDESSRMGTPEVYARLPYGK